MSLPAIILTVFCAILFATISFVKSNWETAATNTLRCGEKGVEIVERPAVEGLVATKFIVCKK